MWWRIFLELKLLHLFTAFFVMLVEADATLEFTLATYGGRMVERENLSPQQPPQTLSEPPIRSFIDAYRILWSFCRNGYSNGRLLYVSVVEVCFIDTSLHLLMLAMVGEFESYSCLWIACFTGTCLGKQIKRQQHAAHDTWMSLDLQLCAAAGNNLAFLEKWLKKYPE
ncbi:hypothetical protein Tco_0857657 [Tanacetum coccineum]|uniref:Secreted protein n=1 Tax=Tanacetum coccineum TaxID=301880 RepID=A0ABQ5B775_9ASTR